MKFFAEEFDKFCGIAKVEHPETQKAIFVVYADLISNSEEDKENTLEAGEVIGWGETKEKALAEAVKNLVEVRREYDRSFYEIKEKLENIFYCPFGRKRKTILPVDFEDDFSPKSTHNADVFIQWKEKKVELGIA